MYFRLTYMTFFYIARFIDMIQIYHTIPFLMDLLGLVLAVSLALTQVYSSDMLKQKYVERIKMQKRDLFQMLTIGVNISELFGNGVDLEQEEKIKTRYSISYRYNSEWYNADVSEQKSLLLIIKRRFNPLVLTACRFYVMSLPKFGMVRKKYAVIKKGRSKFEDSVEETLTSEDVKMS
ncbi:Uncharacterized protein DBV15_02406 [Temnothorax longispinosus]|uniref:Uncharacterized protein n=1 Tax=Temnothorax longispinosus TaxID=300112 RepID=A0A4S2KVR9_9HYME|nr:Uncharacterized protein DBV15_02406 [Temnothorax longispinosus]